jgi:putative endonuclease
MKMTHYELGKWGERKALTFLSELGFNVLDKNVKRRKNEIDLVAIDNVTQELVVVEVKTRQTAEIGPPWKAVTRAKQRQIIHVANWLVKERQIDREVRFDIISIVHNSYRTEIEHLRNAFAP